MSHRLTYTVTIAVRSPFLFRGLAGGAYGVDTAHLRDELGRPIIPADQLRGVLRQSLEDLAAVDAGITDQDIADLFGKKSDGEDDSGENKPIRGHIVFTDLAANLPDTSSETTRIEIDVDTGSVRQGHLQVAELVAPFGQVVPFRGEIVLFRPAAEADRWTDLLGKALRLVSAIGAFKSPGFGEVVQQDSAIVFKNAESLALPAAVRAWDDDLRFQLCFDRPMLVDAEHISGNAFLGSTVIPGAVIIKPIAIAALQRLAPPAARPAGRPPGRPAGRGAPPAERPDPGVTPQAPFRFVALPDAVVMPEEAATGDRDRPIAGGVCAEIAVTWEAESPLLIGDGKDGVVQPLRLGAEGGYVIPGASLRGMLRAAVEIVAHGRLGAANLHHRYGLRDFDHPAYADRSPVSKVAEVRAGWLSLADDGGWQITPCDWSHVLIEDLLGSTLSRWGTREREEWIGRTLDAKYDAARMKDGKLYDFTLRYGFAADRDDNGRRVTHPSGSRQGTLVFSNRLPGRGGKKKFEYVFFDRRDAQPVALKPDIVATFERLYSKPSKNKPAPDGSWRDLKPTLDAGRRLPVFFVGALERQDERFFFGLTRLFKVPHERSVRQVLAQTQPAHLPTATEQDGQTVYAPDFVENLFGYLVEPDDIGRTDRVPPQAAARKGRIAVEFARLQGDAEMSAPVATVMMAPRASFAPFYLQSAAEKDYSAETSPKLAGRKRYLPRYPGPAAAQGLRDIAAMGERQIRLIEEGSRGKPVNADVQTRLAFLLPKPGGTLRFTGRIRLHNVTKAELGAVLFALTHGGDTSGRFRHMLGRAKPFGAGQVRVAARHLSVVHNDDGRRVEDEALEEYLDAFIDHVKTRVPGFPDVPAIREFLGACDPEGTPPGLDYMPLADFKKIRDAVKPERQRANGAPPRPPRKLQGEAKDGRLLAAPERKFWR